MKTLGILIGAALVLATTAHDARATGTGGFKTTCPGIADMLQMDFESCQFNARQKTGAERQKHWKWCKFQHKNAADFIRLCHKFSGQCYQGRVNWNFTFYDFLPERPYDPPGIPASFPGSATTAYGGMNCGEAPDGWLPPGEAREAREREEREREAAETPDTAPGTEGREAAEPPAPAVVLEPKCEGAAKGAECWERVSGGRKCRYYNPFYHGLKELTITWSGSCYGGVATGAGTLKGSSFAYTGTFTDGKLGGKWILRFGPFVYEGPYVNGKRHGYWVEKSDISVADGLYVNGEKHGRWVTRYNKPLHGENNCSSTEWDMGKSKYGGAFAC